MLDVVVLPWVPETAIVGLSRVSSPSRSARCISGRAALRVGRAGSRSSRRPRRPRGRWRRRGRSAARSRPRAASAAYGEPAARSEPVTSAPSAWATAASPLMPAPPIPTKCSLRPDQGWSIPVTLGRLADESRIDRVAREAFGYSELRPGQREAIESALAGHDALVVMSTGSGKSAIYQIAGLLTPGATVVVSPLIALQRDQVESLDQGRGRRRGAAELDDQRGASASTRCTSWPRGRSSSCSSRPSSSRARRCWTS